MKKFLLTTAGLFALTFNVMAASFQVGVLDMHQIMADAPQVKTIRDNLQKQFKSREESLVKDREAFQKEATKFQKDATIMSKKELESMQKKMMEEQHNLQKEQASFQQDVMQAQNAALKSFVDDVKIIVKRIAKKQHLNLVITKDTIAFADTKLDVTSQVMQELKKS